jgi:hypothetical protein
MAPCAIASSPKSINFCILLKFSDLLYFLPDLIDLAKLLSFSLSLKYELQVQPIV